MFGFSENKKIVSDGDKLNSVLDAILRKWENSSYEDISRQVVDMFPEKYRNVTNNKIGFVFPDFTDFQIEISFSEVGRITNIYVTGRGDYAGVMIVFTDGSFFCSAWSGLAFKATRKAKKLVSYFNEKHGFQIISDRKS